MDEKTFKTRTKRLAMAIIKEVDKLPRSLASDVFGKQLVRSGTSIGANYRAACRAKSSADMINKMKIVEEESDETEYWLDSWWRRDLSLKVRLPAFTKRRMKSLQ